MMPRFRGLSGPLLGFPNGETPVGMTLPWRDDDGKAYNLGHLQGGQPREWSLPNMTPVRDWHDLSVTTGEAATPDAVVDSPNPPGATHPDLIVIPGMAAAGGGGLTIGTVAILALLAVGGWFLYRRFAK